MPSSSSNKEHIGMLPPPRTGIGVFPKVVSIALVAALYPLLFIGVIYGSPPWCRVAFMSTQDGAIFFKCWMSRSVILLLSWLGTNLAEIFAKAFEGSTVLAPSPVYPPQIPFNSSEGLIPVLSYVV